MSSISPNALNIQSRVALDLTDDGDQNAPQTQLTQPGQTQEALDGAPQGLKDADNLVAGGGAPDGGPPAPSPAFSSTTDNGLSPMRPSVVRKTPPSPEEDKAATVKQWLKKSRQQDDDPDARRKDAGAPPPQRLTFGQVPAPAYKGPRLPAITPAQKDVFGPVATYINRADNKQPPPAEGSYMPPGPSILWSNGHNTVRMQSGYEYPPKRSFQTPPPSTHNGAGHVHYHGSQDAAHAAAHVDRMNYRAQSLPSQPYPPGLHAPDTTKSEPSEPSIPGRPGRWSRPCGINCAHGDCDIAALEGPERFTPEQIRREAAGLADDPLSDRTATSDAGTDDVDMCDDQDAQYQARGHDAGQNELGSQLEDPIEDWSDVGGADLGNELEDEPQRPPLTEEQRTVNSDIAPEFRHSTVPMRATAIVREPIDSMKAGQILRNMDAADKNVFDAMLVAKKKIFGIFLHSVDGDTNIGAMNQTLLNMDFQETLRQTEPGSKLALAPVRASQHGHPVKPGLFIAHNLRDRTHRNYTDRTFFMVDKYCFGTFIYDHPDSYFFGTWWNTMMPRTAMETEFRTACNNSARVRRVFLDIEVKHPGQGQLAWARFRESLEVRELAIVPKRGVARVTPEYNIYSRPVVYKAHGKTVGLTPAQYDNLQSAMATVRVPSTLLGAATKRPSYDCPICMAKSHPRGMCPALGIPGWAHVLLKPARPPKASGSAPKPLPQLPPPLHFGPPKRGRSSRIG
ncbi:hypothetical protein AURDEDRAFT_164849 [Auricularia subglabra TFB-10046 SS5]|nr:hypothetical protein AURDEDRAFT_164849 [Auricularia subglabra TFB-10046 SS5]